MPIYLDNNSSTPCAPEVIEAMLPFLAGMHANPASPHIMGRQAARAMAKAREQVGQCVDADAADIVFVGSATEGNNMAILGMAHTGARRRKIVVSAVEHKSVLEPCHALGRQGFEIVVLPVDSEGTVLVDAARDLIDDDTLLVAVQGANNEIGTVQPVADIAEIAHSHGALLHCDATQLLGKVAVSAYSLAADTLVCSAHKAYGPKGIGCLVLTRHVASQLQPMFHGGGQEHGLRPGTPNMPGIVGMGEACRLCLSSVEADGRRMEALRAAMELGVGQSIPGASIIGVNAQRLPGTSSILLAGCPSDLVVTRTPQVCMGTGSACNSGAYTPSHVLLALGLSHEDARSTLRLSLGRYTTEAETFTAVDELSRSIATIRCESQSSKTGEDPDL